MYKTALGTAPINTETTLWGVGCVELGAPAAISPQKKYCEPPRSPADSIISFLMPGQDLSSEALPQLRLEPSLPS